MFCLTREATMRTFGAGLTTLALGLATCLGALAQVERQKNRDEANQNQNARGETKTIRGVIGAVTVEGETLIDQRTHRAVVASEPIVLSARPVWPCDGRGWARSLSRIIIPSVRSGPAPVRGPSCAQQAGSGGGTPRG
jgi:hypothetical protein